jgi:hypothetical protein
MLGGYFGAHPSGSVLGPVLLGIGSIGFKPLFELMEHVSYFQHRTHVRARAAIHLSRNSISPSGNVQPIVVNNRKLFI